MDLQEWLDKNGMEDGCQKNCFVCVCLIEIIISLFINTHKNKQPNIVSLQPLIPTLFV